MRRLAVASVGLALPVTALSGCNGAEGAGPGGKGGKGKGGKGRGGYGEGGGGGAEALAVELATTEPATIERHHRASGTLEALRRAEIRPVRAGIIEDLDVEVGDTVEEGQVLARLDGRELSLQARRDKIAAGNVAREVERLEQLERSGAIAAEEIDARRYELETAKAAAKLSRTQASTMTVRAPFSGVVVRRDVDVGNLASTGTSICEIADLSALELTVHLPEREAARVKKDAEVEVELVDGSTFTAKVVRRAPIVDALTGTVEFLVRAEDFPELAVPGSFVRARILLERLEAEHSVPRAAVFELEGQRYVYAMREGKARRVAVEVGLEGTERAQILSGLDGSERLLVDAEGITEGMAVKGVGEDPPAQDGPLGEGEGEGGKKGGRRKSGFGGKRRRR
ncbi:membrane fusion protein [Plesiocystis pacifica SIR-1]|uniref:Membrane fusion protein n=1 Tax=Plesiocystis pacifica SIR-1 TaxID=391625 RepID=A6GKK3_9BACT|nr:membrane fusion protein [Plesiocystis pacifica SIR-1]